jgi:hypothetical protein
MQSVVVHIVILSVFDAIVHMTHFAALCIVVHHLLVPPVVQFDVVGALSQFE